MRQSAPHPLIRFRHALIGMALLAWAAMAALIVFYKNGVDLPVSEAVGVLGLIFVWSNGLYWWVLLRYPYLEASKGTYANRDELNGKNSRPFLICYFAVAVAVSVGCLNITANG